MQVFSSAGNRKQAKQQQEAIKKEGFYFFYDEPPMYDILMRDIEKYSIERNNFDRIIADHAGEGKTKDYHNDIKNAAKAKNWSLLLSEVSDKDKEAFLKKDMLSHFMLRLAHCKTKENRDWFLNMECALFRARLRETKNVQAFLKRRDIQLEEVKRLEDFNNEERAFLKQSFGDKSEGKFFKIDWLRLSTQGLGAIRNRTSILIDGYTYLPMDDAIDLAVQYFRATLNQALSIASKELPNVESDERIRRLVHLLEDRMGINNKKLKDMSGFALTLANVDAISVSSFPPCMRYQFERLRADHHLKHWSRMQLQLYLKAAGMSLDDQLKLWKIEFTKKMAPEKFDREHGYNLRHNYGKEGTRVNYSAYGCYKIIMNNAPGPGDCHGCPFRHLDKDNRRKILRNWGMKDEGLLRDIEDLVKDNHYQYFKFMHPDITEVDTINHPNGYYEKSRDPNKTGSGSGGAGAEFLTSSPIKSQPTASNSAPPQDESMDVEHTEGQ